MNTSKIKVFEEESGHPFEHWDGGDAPVGTVALCRKEYPRCGFLHALHSYGLSKATA